MDEKFHDDVLAEFAALNMAVTKLLQTVADLKGDRRAYLERVFEEGDRALANTNYWSVPPERMEDFLEKARARYADIIGSINAPPKA